MLVRYEKSERRHLNELSTVCIKVVVQALRENMLCWSPRPGTRSLGSTSAYFNPFRTKCSRFEL